MIRLTGGEYDKAKLEYEKARAKLDATMNACRYCKLARSRGKDGCKKHVREGYLIYVTSPHTETYWST